MSDKMNQANPRITDVVIGIRVLRSITIYPLSLADQFSMDEIIAKAMQGFVSSQDEASEADVIKFVFEVVRDNIAKVLSLVTEEDGEVLLKEIDDVQLSEIVEAIYVANYETSIKNVLSLFEKAREQFQLKRQLPSSVNDMEGID